MIKPIETETLQFDNQCLLLSITIPSGCLHILDKISGIAWTTPAASCGNLVVQKVGQEKCYGLGQKGDTGVLFHVERYAVRAGDEEDFEEITLCGSLGDDPDSQITIQYLLSTSNPIIDCHLFLSGPVAESIRHLEFPAGIEFPLSPSNHLYLPLDLSLLRSLEECGPQLPLWEPVDKENHQVYGSPFVILTKTETEEKSAACIGYLHDPRCHWQIRLKPGLRSIVPTTAQPAETGYVENKPYTFRYQFFPSNQLQAIYWLCYEHLSKEGTP
ncbi:MAG: hypothetical protein RBU29_10440 [bacterium]|jgi:hypothetical protein|nr:hypothetical protein [bacterium]